MSTPRNVWEFVEGRLTFGANVRAAEIEARAPNRQPGTQRRPATAEERSFKLGARCFETHDEALAEAQRIAKELDREIGLLRVRSPRKGWHEYFKVFLLPPEHERCDEELRCQVVRP